jgi:glycosyltransferase involved in cell wall biosynthesis
VNVLVVGTGSGFVSGISTATDQTETALRCEGHAVLRVAAGTRARRRPNRINLENVGAVVGDALMVAREARRFRADVIWYHTFGVPLLPAVRALLVVVASRAVGRPAVVRLQAFGLVEFVRSSGPGLRAVLRVLGRAASAVVVEHAESRRALEPFVPAERLFELGNWVSVPERPSPLPPGPPWRLAFVGGLVERKGAPQLVEAVRLLDGEPVVACMVGGAGEDGPEALGRLRAAAADLAASGRVAFAGELGPKGVREQLRGAHLFVLPTRAEGSPLAMLEAMAEGRPVLVGDAGNVRSIVEGAGCGVVLDDRAPEAIAAAIRALVADPDRLAAMGARGHEVAMADHSGVAGAAGVRRVLAAVPMARAHRSPS